MTVNVGLIGVGYWGPNLLRNLYNLPDCNLISVCEKCHQELHDNKGQKVVIKKKTTKGMKLI